MEEKLSASEMQRLNDALLAGGIPAGQIFIVSGDGMSPNREMPEIDSVPAPMTEEPDYSKVKGAYFDGARERYGNNRQHVKPDVARKKRKAQRVARRQNRSK